MDTWIPRHIDAVWYTAKSFLWTTREVKKRKRETRYMPDETTMTNVNYRIEGSTLFIEVNLAETHGLSDSGKSFVIASTKGNKEIAETDDGSPIALGLNVYHKNLNWVKPAKQPKTVTAKKTAKPVTRARTKKATPATV